MSHGYTAHGEFQPDQVVTLPEPEILSELEGPAQPDAVSPPSESANLSKDSQSPTDLQWHPVAELFPIPGGEEMSAMVDDLKANGLREPGKTWKGFGIDGRFRAAACQRAEVEFRTEEIDLPDEAAVIAYIMSRNIRRRQMSEAQRAMVAARMIPFYAEAAQKRMKAGKKANPKANLTEGEKGAVREVVAKLMNVSSGSVGNAARLLKQGCPELIQQVERGEISVSAATDVSGLTKGQQKKIAQGGKKAIKAKAKEIRMNRKPLRQALDDANADNNDSRHEPTSDVTHGSSDASHIVPTLQVAPDSCREPQPKTEKSANPEPLAWITKALHKADLTGITWVLLGYENPPAYVNEHMRLFVRPRQCFRSKPETHEPKCVGCPDQVSCEEATKHPVCCFASKPEFCDREILTAYDCEECPYSTECVMATVAIADYGCLDFSAHYGNLKGSGCWSELYIVPSGSDTPVLVNKYPEEKMALTTRRWSSRIRRFLKDESIREIFQMDHRGHMITRTTKDPEKTVWYVVNKKPGATA